MGNSGSSDQTRFADSEMRRPYIILIGSFQYRLRMAPPDRDPHWLAYRDVFT